MSKSGWGTITDMFDVYVCIFLQMYWVNLNAGYDGDIYYTIVANSFVHLVMYVPPLPRLSITYICSSQSVLYSFAPTVVYSRHFWSPVACTPYIFDPHLDNQPTAVYK